MRSRRVFPSSLFRRVASAAAFAVVLSSLTLSLHAQVPVGVIAGRVADSSGKGIDGALIHVVGTRLGSQSDSTGAFRVIMVPPGTYRVTVVSLLGFSPDTFSATVAANQTVRHDVQLKFTGATAAKLATVFVTAERLGQTMAEALNEQKNATNIINVMSGDEIRALPNYNAAEAAGRISGVSLERDEGEGKYVQVRGTEPRLTNVTVNGAQVPGTSTDRIVKLDDVPSDILGAIKVSKTLTADMNANAIGGSVDLVTKTPEDAPQGYVSGQFGAIDLLGKTSGQAGFTYGGRYGAANQTGFLIGASWDRSYRAINDVEPAWAYNGDGTSHPVEWSQRDYLYDRTRIGVGGDLDYRFDEHNTIYLKGMYSHFQNFGTRYVYDVASSDDSAASGTSGFGTGVEAVREVEFRTPTEQLWGGSAGGLHEFSKWTLNYQVNYTGTSQIDNNYRSSSYAAAGSGNMTVNYNYADRMYPTFNFPDPAQAAAAVAAGDYSLDGYDTDYDRTTAYDVGGNIDLLRQYSLGDHTSWFKFGVRLRDDNKVYNQNEQSFASNTPFAMSSALASFTDPHFYSRLSPSYPLGPVPDFGSTQTYENANPGAFDDQTDTLGNQLASFTGSEKIYAGYLMNTTEFGPMLVNIGLRVEQTNDTYSGNAVTQDSLGNTFVTPVAGSSSYADWFPSLQLKYSTESNWNYRFAVTRGIARPNYSDLAPSLSGVADPALINDYSNVSAGNPDLKAQTAWNYNVMVEHFFRNVGILSGGIFYKQISNFIFTRNFRYAGPYAPLVGYAGTQPQNGNDGHLSGLELEWIQHFSFLPGWTSGFGIDANYTHTKSSAVVPCSDVGVGGCSANGSDTTRTATLPRQAPDLWNVALIYDRGVVSARIAWTYNGASIYSYGDGSNSGETGDTYFYPHSQFDASIMWNVTRTTQLQFQVLNMNNAVFGFNNGVPGDNYNIQREYYGATFFLGVRYGFVGY